MSVKKFLVLTAAGIASVGATAALAGGPDAMQAPVFQPNIYVEVNLGYVQSNWRSFAITPFVSFGDNINGGFTFGFALGYNFMKHFSAEIGWDWIPEAKGSTAAVNNNNLTVQSWIFYLAGKLDVPLMDNLDLFGKFGAAYRSLDWAGAAAVGAPVATIPGGSQSYWSPFFAAGGQYAFNDNLYMTLQWKHVSANNDGGNASEAAPSANFYTAGLGYRFAM